MTLILPVTLSPDDNIYRDDQGRPLIRTCKPFTCGIKSCTHWIVKEES